MRAGKRFITAEVAEEFVEEVRMQAMAERRPMSEIIREALRQYLQRERVGGKQDEQGKVVNE